MRANNSDVNRLFVFMLFLFSAANSSAELSSSSTGTSNYSRTTGAAISTTMSSTTGSMTGPESLSHMLGEVPLIDKIVFIAVAALCLIGLASILYTRCRRKGFHWQSVSSGKQGAGSAGGEARALHPNGRDYGTAAPLTPNLRASGDDYTGPESDDGDTASSQSGNEQDTSDSGSSSASRLGSGYGSESE